MVVPTPLQTSYSGFTKVISFNCNILNYSHTNRTLNIATLKRHKSSKNGSTFSTTTKTLYLPLSDYSSYRRTSRRETPRFLSPFKWLVNFQNGISWFPLFLLKRALSKNHLFSRRVSCSSSYSNIGPLWGLGNVSYNITVGGKVRWRLGLVPSSTSFHFLLSSH